MNELMEQVYAASERVVDNAPSGIVYTIRRASSAAYVRSLGAIPALSANGKINLADSMASNAKLVRECICRMEWQGTTFDVIPPSEELPKDDVAHLIPLLDLPFQQNGKAVEEARGAL